MSNIKKVTIKLNTSELTIEGIYVPECKGTIDVPTLSEEFEINTVMYNNTDITELLEDINNKLWRKDCPEIWGVILEKVYEEIHRGDD